MGRKTKYISVLHQLRYQILSGEWPIGSTLPPERKLAEQLGVSRNTVVRAYSELEAEGLIAGRMGSGRFVQPLAPLPTVNGIDWRKRLDEYQHTSGPSHMADLLSISSPHNQVINFTHGDGGKQTLASSGFPHFLKQTADRIESYYFLPINGHPELREWIVSWMDVEQISSAEQVVITSGSQEALQLAATLLAKPGDSIAVEMPTYFGALQLFESLGLRIIPIPLDPEGMRVDVLEGVLTRYSPRFVYTVPTFHNPTGYTLSLERRQRLIQLSEQYNLPIIEDDAYRHLHLYEEPPVSLKSLDQTGNVIYINSFSKVLFPGLRLGWIAATRSFIRHISRLKEQSITTNTYGQLALLSFLQEGALLPHLERARSLYRCQAELMGHHLKQLQPYGLSFEQPNGGFYYWVSLPQGTDARDVLRQCMSQGVSFAVGDMFLTREAVQPFIRLCFSHEPKENIEAGMAILTAELKKRKELVS
ncbi:PLP-dependent aminotransferase family protein [Brevibacillus humidisoli]|uniref:MocR-like pyridoxine biosynthesis transcription factor PdxR n=1 Tax=Brevibacillus humidisoli TaxID=2895522 RepID=UPI001E34BD1D|nr:PLP-dependent aminotransferase family protein [Brevibacillus humidisoli]UFJ41686.1 PLP-dependent aminotransferase family protein [Brevibacillus humidisoli]